MSQIADLLNIFIAPLQQYAEDGGHKAFIASDLQHAWNYCFQNENTAKIILMYAGERMRGDPVTNSIYRHVDMDFTMLVSRNRPLSVDRALTLYQDAGNSVKLFQIVEDVRDIIRYTNGIAEIVEWPIAYKGAAQWELPGVIMDAYKIDFSCAVILCDGGLTPQVTAP